VFCSYFFGGAQAFYFFWLLLGISGVRQSLAARQNIDSYWPVAAQYSSKKIARL